MQNPNYSVPLEQGAPFVLRPADPGAGNDLAILVPNHVRWLIHYLTFTLTTAVGGAVRRPTFRVDDVTGNFISFEANATQAAAIARVWAFTPQPAPTGTTIGGNLYASMPENILLLPNMTLTMLIQTIAAGDTITNARLYGRRWIERSV